MIQKLQFYNTLSRKKEVFEPLNPPHCGIYVCGPTVYGDPHLGHARPAITFDLIFRFMTQLGYKVRYVRNITDVGHLEHDADSGEDKIAKKARLEKLEPMEVAQYYTNRYHESMRMLNVLPPSIEPRASGHIIEQMELVDKILKAGYAYVSNGSVYFDVKKFNESHQYGKLSGRVLEELQANTRELDGQEEKQNPYDFALWKKASPEHIMRWNSPWSIGFPGWHLECSAMSAKYLGEQFDIHGGGMDLVFPHHESEIAQSTAANGTDPCKYWIHNNMITINGQKMGKSLNNFITLEEFFTGNHPLLTQAYSPMSIRFFILQAHYRSTLDFSNEAIQASEKGLKKLLSALADLEKIKTSETTGTELGTYINGLRGKCYEAMCDDFNSPVAIAVLFESVKWANALKENKSTISQADKDKFIADFENILFDILGIVKEPVQQNVQITDDLMNIILSLRQEAKAKKDFATSDLIRNKLQELKINIKDTKDGPVWSVD
ncbi:MAG TPA: cysteine--tRNA ligase [Bacteroidales bacterium]|nr:cysteine--tRNA ligase [Bacteroidales bacterium]